MNSSFSGETALRKYLLGTLGQQECDDIEEQLLSNEEFAKLIDLVEDEIIDDYVDRSLSPQEQQAVETYFLRPPARQTKLKFARMLRKQLRQEDQVLSVTPPAALPPPHRRWIYWGASGAMAAMFLLTASLGVYTSKLRRNLETESARSRKIQEDLAEERAVNANLKKQASTLQEDRAEAERSQRAQADLAQERALNASLKRETEMLRKRLNIANLLSNGITFGAHNTVEMALQSDADSYVTLHLSPILTMDSANNLPVFRPRPGRILKIVIPLIDIPPQSYHVSLLAPDGTEIWSLASVAPTAPFGDELVFPISYSQWRPGSYSVVLTGSLDNLTPLQAKYYFRVLKFLK